MEQHEESESGTWNQGSHCSIDQWEVRIPDGFGPSLINLHIGTQKILPPLPELCTSLYHAVSGYTSETGVKGRLSESLRVENSTSFPKKLVAPFLKIVDQEMKSKCPEKARAVRKLFEEKLAYKGIFPLDKRLEAINRPVLDLVRKDPGELVNPNATFDSPEITDSDERDLSKRSLALPNNSKRHLIPLGSRQPTATRITGQVPPSLGEPIRNWIVCHWSLATLILLGSLAVLPGIYFSSWNLVQRATPRSSPGSASVTRMSSPSLSQPQPVILYLQSEKSEYERSTNKIFSEYLRGQLRNVGELNVQILGPEPGHEITRTIAESIRNSMHAKSVIWLATAEAPAGKRLYISQLSPETGIVAINAQSTLDNKDLKSFGPIDDQARGLYILLINPLLSELAQARDYARIQEVISKSYEYDPVLKKRGAFVPMQADLLALKKNFSGALELLEGDPDPPKGDETNAHSLLRPKLVRDCEKAILLYRLGKYEDAYATIAEGRIIGGRLDQIKDGNYSLTVSGPMLAYTSSGIIFLRLDYPEGMATMIRHDPSAMLVFDSPYTGGFDTALNSHDGNGYLRDSVANLVKGFSGPVESGLYLAKPDRIPNEGQLMMFELKRLRDIMPVTIHEHS